MVNEDSISVDPDKVVAFLQLAADTRVSPQQRQRTLSLVDCDVDNHVENRNAKKGDTS